MADEELKAAKRGWAASRRSTTADCEAVEVAGPASADEAAQTAAALAAAEQRVLAAY